MHVGSDLGQEAAFGNALYERGEFAAARRCFERALAAEPRDASLHFKIATCHWGEGTRYAAARALETAVTLKPDLACAHEWLGQWCLQEGIGEAALRHSLAAVRLAPHDASTLTSHAFVLEAAGDLDAAWALIRRLIGAGYTPPRAAMLYGRLARRNRKMRRALRLVQKLLENSARPAERKSLHFTAAELSDRVGKYAAAFAHAEQANRIMPKPWDANRCAREFERLIEYFTADRLKSLARARNRSGQPVLVVGMPRSGTSLVEQIVASHPRAHGAGELDFVDRVRLGAISMLGATEEQFPECLDGFSPEQADGLAEVYLEPLKAMAPGAVRITDKMPLNFIHLGLVSLLLPGARVIHCSRDPMDTCLSCYLTHFTAGHEFTSDLGDLGAFYRLYARLMDHWAKVLPLPILDVSYEALVTDPKREMARVLEFLGLPWDRNCLQFHENRRFVTTASVEQVRRPLYSTSVGRWKNYRQWLSPLERALNGGATQFTRT
jgi:tetratricopeptide (TPR) repeat protein